MFGGMHWQPQPLAFLCKRLKKYKVEGTKLAFDNKKKPKFDQLQQLCFCSDIKVGILAA